MRTAGAVSETSGLEPAVGPCGAVAQLGERRFCKPEAVGSIPISSIRLSAQCPVPFQRDGRGDSAGRIQKPA
jgi:hypothetical protein